MRWMIAVVLMVFGADVATGQIPGNAARFSENGDYISVPHDTSLQLSSAVTLAAWVKRTRLNDIDFILEKGGDWNLGDANYGMALHNVNNNMFYFIYKGGWRGTDGVADTNWHHYAAVAVNGAADPELYIDGVRKTILHSGGTSTISLNAATTRPLHIGSQIEDPCCTHYSENIIDELSVWNRALDSAQIAAIKADTLGPAYTGTADSGLVGYWRLEMLENLGISSDGTDDLRDYSSRGNHGDAVGNVTMVAVDFPTSARGAMEVVPDRIRLEQNYPNPFNPTTRISFSVPFTVHSSLKVLDVVGREVAVLLDREMETGRHMVEWNAAGFSAGVYYVQLRAGAHSEVKKLVLVK